MRTAVSAATPPAAPPVTLPNACVNNTSGSVFLEHLEEMSTVDADGPVANAKHEPDDTFDFDPEVLTRTKEIWAKLETGSRRLNNAKRQLADSKVAASRLTGELSEQLASYKRHLVGRGREGSWGAFLATVGISRTTADRYVKRHKLQQDKTSINDQAPAPDPIKELAKLCQRKLKVHITTERLLPELLRNLADELHAIAKASVTGTEDKGAEVAG